MPAVDSSWDGIDAFKYADERRTIRSLLERQPLSEDMRKAIVADAVSLVETTRRLPRRSGVIENFLQEFSLGTREGLALMCLAEALLRTPDAATRDLLIAERIGSADWASHLGNSSSLFVNASTWGLMLTGRLVDVDEDARSDFTNFLRRTAARLGEPLIRHAVATAVRIIGEQFVLAHDIGAALNRARHEGYLCSFDMLGEGARTTADAAQYEHAYTNAIVAVGDATKGIGSELGHGISVKLSALSPRYEAVQESRVWDELYPRLKRLASVAAKYNLGFAIDAEEADRLVLSLKLFEHLAGEETLAGWQGQGFVVQAYQKRAPQVIAGLSALARKCGRRFPVRLVKGAYWDGEIKEAQVEGYPGYPVFTTKAATDLSYLVCAKALIDAAPLLLPQFATHNAHTIAATRQMAINAGVDFEYQRLHGMGEALYRAASQKYGALRLRVYAPVGGHEELLPYLVRRLLENGANTSFVNRLLDERLPVEKVVTDPISVVEDHPGPHPRIPLPADIYGSSRRNSLGRDYSILEARKTAMAATTLRSREPLQSGPIVEGRLQNIAPVPITNPSNRQQVIGTASQATAADIDRAVTAARTAQAQWNDLGGAGRAPVLRAMGDVLEDNMDALVALLAMEAGKTLSDAVAEVREAIDFCRFYAQQAEVLFRPSELQGPVGEMNQLELAGRGVFACISPWNFPLSIFTGQIAAALAAGNAALAKPAEQTPLIAGYAVQLFHRAGLDPRLLALLPGAGKGVGGALVGHRGIDGVVFTGGTETAWSINRQLAAREGPIIPFIAETGGLNGMFVDTTALKEQVVDDVILSAFGSAGQRCSALRLLFLPRTNAEGLIDSFKGAMDALVIGDPADPATDVGPVIDADAKAALTKHWDRLKRDAKILHTRDVPALGEFFPPVLAEIPRADFLDREVFGPILHIFRYDPAEIDKVAMALASRRYGLTLGIHSRLDSFVEKVRRLVPAGNVYVNRAIIGAVVGVQPFGGEGLSGTGPKVGGPHTLLRYATERSLSVNIAAQGGDPKLLNL